jgi:MFS family permease
LLQLGFGFSAFQAGLMTLASAVGSLAMRFTFRPLLRPLGFRRLLIGNAAVMGAFLIGCGFFQITTPYLVIVVALLIGGFSRSVQFTAVQSLGYAEMPTELFSRATSFQAMAQQLCQSFGVGLAALMVHLSLIWHDRVAIAPADVALGYFAIGSMSLLSVAIFYRLPAHAGVELSDR